MHDATAIRTDIRIPTPLIESAAESEIMAVTIDDERIDHRSAQSSRRRSWSRAGVVAHLVAIERALDTLAVEVEGDRQLRIELDREDPDKLPEDPDAGGAATPPDEAGDRARAPAAAARSAASRAVRCRDHTQVPRGDRGRPGRRRFGGSSGQPTDLRYRK